jgi:hypothetical protein
VPELNDTADISTERISQAGRQARESYSFGCSMKKQLLSNKKIPIDIRRRLYQAIVVNIQYVVLLWTGEAKAGH